jgi:peptidoglycan hydrolase-like protein with peptidoglycan-binding domain
MNFGLMSIITLAGAISTVVLWGMSANDPYWRLVEAPSVPAPAYQGADDLRAMLAAVPLEFSNTDAGAMNPASGLPASGPSVSVAHAAFPLDSTAREVSATPVPEPMTALVLPLAPESMISPAIDAMIAYEQPRAAASLPADFGADVDLVVARTPQSLPAPMALRDSDAGVVATTVSARTLDLFVVPATPAQPHIAASQDTEEGLALKRGGRVDVQRRLVLAGFDPNGLDGVFGARTRGAITDFQTAWGFPATGYLDTSVYGELNQRTEDAYQALLRQAAAAPSSAPGLAPVAQERQLASAEDDGGCARQPNGRIIERQSLACDIIGFGETFVSMGRNTLEYGEDGAVAASASLGADAGAER